MRNMVPANISGTRPGAEDHPEGTEVWPNEMMAVSAKPPDFEVFCYRTPLDPVRVVDHRGADVTERLRKTDRRGSTAGSATFADADGQYGCGDSCDFS